MSADSQAFDPYRSPSMPEVPYAGPPPAGRSGWLTTLCVLCIVLGALGLVNSAFGTLGMIVGKKIQQTMAAQPQPGMPADLQEAQQKMQEEMYAIQDKYWTPLVLAIVFRVVVGALLVLGGVRSLGLHESGRKLLILACAVALVFDTLQTILQSIMTMENMTIVNSYLEVMTGKTSGVPANMEAIVQVISSILRFFAIALIYVIALAKIALYVFGLVYLRKPLVIALFRNSSALPALNPVL